MNDQSPPSRSAGVEAALTPLEGEQGIPSVSAPRRAATSIKAIMAVVILLAGLAFLIYGTIHQAVSSGQEKGPRKGPKAAATVTSGRTFDPDSRPAGEAPPASTSAALVVPAIETATSDTEAADPIGLRGAQTNKIVPRKRSPFDGPVLLPLVANPEATRVGDAEASGGEPSSQSPTSAARASLDSYRQQLQGMLGNLQKITAPGGGVPAPAASPAPAVLGGQLTASATARVSASRLSDPSLTLPRGTPIACALKTRIVSEQSGFVSCQVLRNAYSADGRVLLVERGSHLDGEYTARVKTGQARIFVVWSRLRTPSYVVVDLGSPATGPLGEAGVEGYVDNHWRERIGAALLLSVLEDGTKIAAAEAGSHDARTAIVLQDSADTTSSLSEKVLDNTINIPPTIFKNQGGVVGVYVAKDVDFSSVYELRTVAR